MPEFDRIRGFFAEWVATNGNKGAVGEIAQWLAESGLEPGRHAEIVERHGVAREPWFCDALLDLVIAFAQQRFGEGPPSLEDVSEIRLLRGALHVHDEALFERRPVEISRLLQGVFEAVLSDGVIEEWEDLYLVEVQAAFGLSYDQLLILARPALERAVAALRSAYAKNTGLIESQLSPEQKLAALEPMYRLAVLRPRTLGALY